MYLVFVVDVEHMMNADASALMVLALLALGPAVQVRWALLRSVHHAENTG
jgi:hypothetical protein